MSQRPSGRELHVYSRIFVVLRQRYKNYIPNSS